MTVKFTPEEMMTIAASNALSNEDICFVGIGAPSAACNLARLTHAHDITLIYESGILGTKPEILPLSIGDGELCDTALTTVSVPEMFAYWLQSERISKGFLGAAQLDPQGNINTTIIGDYESPKTRLPGGGGAPEIATSCQEVLITMKQSSRAMVNQIDFMTSLGQGNFKKDRGSYGVKTKGPTLLITDLAVWKMNSKMRQFEVQSLHQGVTKQMMTDTCQWEIIYVDNLEKNPAPSDEQLEVLRDLKERTVAAHSSKKI